MSDQANRQADALIAEKVMRLELASPPPYTTNMDAAWQVVEALLDAGYEVVVLSTTKAHESKGRWTCAIARGGAGAKASADTAALAICRAALALVGEQGST